MPWPDILREATPGHGCPPKRVRSALKYLVGLCCPERKRPACPDAPDPQRTIPLEEKRVTERYEINLDLDDIEFDEKGRAIITDKALVQAVRDAKERAEEGYQEIYFHVHSW